MKMPPLAEVQKFIIWIFGSIAVFGCISTLIAFLVYEDKSTMKCDANDIKCKEEEQKKIAVSRNDNEILKIVSPTAIAVGVIVIILVRCWQQSSNRLSTQDPVDDAEPNAMYLGRPCKYCHFVFVFRFCFCKYRKSQYYMEGSRI